MKKFWAILMVTGLIGTFLASKGEASTLPDVKELVKDFEKPMVGLLSTGILPPAGNLGGLVPIPHFSVGLTAPVKEIKYENPVDTKSESLYASLPVAQARIGLFDGLEAGPFKGMGAIDLGVKLGYIPKVDPIKSGSLYGGDIRIGILKDGLATPSIALSITYNTLDLKLKDDDWEVNMDVKTTGVKLLVGKDLPILHPYAAIGYEWYSFEVGYEVNYGDTPLDKYNYKNDDDSLFRILAGCDITVFPFVKLGAEYNLLGDESIYALSLRAGF
ncbi:hypothetical protein KKG61_06105 [bacterium]|nr:hypothetical protein [bacterium]